MSGQLEAGKRARCAHAPSLSCWDVVLRVMLRTADLRLEL